MEYVVRIENSTGRPTAVVRRRARPQELAKIVPETCGIVWSVIRAQQVQGAGRHVALYLDGEINLEVGVELQAPFAGHGDVIGSQLPSGQVATTVHFGPYGALGAAHQAIHDWCEKHAYTPAGASWEIYGHWEDAWNSDPTKIRTDIFYLIRAGGMADG